MEPVSGGHLRVEQLKSGYVHVLRLTMESEQVTNQIKHLIKLQQDKLPKHSWLIHLIFSKLRPMWAARLVFSLKLFNVFSEEMSHSVS